jgi:hypothetical protein
MVVYHVAIGNTGCLDFTNSVGQVIRWEWEMAVTYGKLSFMNLAYTWSS